MSHKNYNIIKLNFDEFYAKDSKPEGSIFTFSKLRKEDSPSQVWKIAHWEEIFRLISDKWVISESNHYNCGLLIAARHFFENNPKNLFYMTQAMGLSLPELSLVIKQGNEKKIFIPNLSISRAMKGEYYPHPTLESFFSSDSFNLIRNIAQYTAVNPDPSIAQEKQISNFEKWVELYGEKASQLLHQSLEFHPGQAFVEGISPDVTLASLGHLQYEEIAQEVILKKTLEQTISEE